MTLRASIEKLLAVRNPGPVAGLLLLPLTICSLLFGWVTAIRSRLYRCGMLRTERIACRLIAVGNLTVGGTGKTPTVCHIARHLAASGLRVAVLCRGYRGSRTDRPQVVSDGRSICTGQEAVGDEAYMLAGKLPGIPVLAAKDRVAAGHMAVEQFQTQVAVLDDGFQYRRLKRDLDLVLVNCRSPFGNGFLLPRGTLREHPCALEKAPAVLLTRADAAASGTAAAAAAVGRYNPEARIFTSVFKPACLIAAADAHHLGPEALRHKRVAGLCSIGDPESFFGMLDALGAETVCRLAFPDHHAYRRDDYAAIARGTRQCDYIVTTEKDIAKIDINMIQVEKLYALEIQLVIDDEEDFFRYVREKAGM